MTSEAENLDIEITEEKIQKAAVPAKRRVEEQTSEESVEISLDDGAEDIVPVTEDEVQEDFSVSPKVEEQSKDLSEVEKRASLAQNRINKAVVKPKSFKEENSWQFSTLKILKIKMHN